MKEEIFLDACINLYLSQLANQGLNNHSIALHHEGKSGLKLHTFGHVLTLFYVEI